MVTTMVTTMVNTMVTTMVTTSDPRRGHPLPWAALLLILALQAKFGVPLRAFLCSQRLKSCGCHRKRVRLGGHSFFWGDEIVPRTQRL